MALTRKIESGQDTKQAIWGRRKGKAIEIILILIFYFEQKDKHRVHNLELST